MEQNRHFLENKVPMNILYGGMFLEVSNLSMDAKKCCKLKT
jgi:hypothetical protein